MRIMGLLIAAGLGAVIVAGTQRLSQPSNVSAPVTARVPTEPSMQPIRPQPFSIRSVRPLVDRVVESLVRAGIPPTRIHLGRYPLRGHGWQAHDVIRLVSFTCTDIMQCPQVFDVLDAELRPDGVQMSLPRGGDRRATVWHRALSFGDRPALALRAYAARPRLSIVIGDVGQEPGLLDQLIDLPDDVTFAVLATSIYAPKIARRLADLGREIIAHLPMEAEPEHIMDTMPFLHTGMSLGSLKKLTTDLLARVPGAVGADGHLGNRFVGSKRHLRAVFDVLQQRGLFFLDDRSSQGAVTQAVTREIGLRTSVRTHRIEDDRQPVIDKLSTIEWALQSEGYAIVVVAPHLRLLRELGPWLERLKEKDVRLLRLSEVVL